MHLMRFWFGESMGLQPVPPITHNVKYMKSNDKLKTKL